MITWIKKIFKKPVEKIRSVAKPAKTSIVKYPPAVQVDVKMKTYAKYRGGWPIGAVVHFTAGRYEGGINKAIDSVKNGAKNGFAFLCIGTDGQVAQGHSLNEWGSHAGKSNWPGVGEAVSSKLIGIEINNAGRLIKKPDGTFQSWFGTEIPKDQVRYVTEEDYGCPDGHYHKYTKAQEDALFELLLWLKEQKPEIFKLDFVLGHHEVAGKAGIGYFRKNDPGGSLSCTMAYLRKRLKDEYNRRQSVKP